MHSEPSDLHGVPVQKPASKHANFPLMVATQVYMQKMAQCLLEVSDSSESQALVDLQRYSMEMTAAFACCWMTTAHRAVAAVIESQNSSCPEGLPDNLYEDLLVSSHFVGLTKHVTCICVVVLSDVFVSLSLKHIGLRDAQTCCAEPACPVHWTSIR